VKPGKTLVRSVYQVWKFLELHDMSIIEELRVEQLFNIMVYTFLRIGAIIICGLRITFNTANAGGFDCMREGKRHEVSAHHNAEAYMDACPDAAVLWQDKKGPLFRTIDKQLLEKRDEKQRQLTHRGMARNDVLRMLKRRALEAGLPPPTCCHTFRATGITAYLENGGSIENTQAIAAHESPRTTKLYERTGDEITLDEVERISI
jgi:integrase/recombinase XerD